MLTWDTWNQTRGIIICKCKQKIKTDTFDLLYKRLTCPNCFNLIIITTKMQRKLI